MKAELKRAVVHAMTMLLHTHFQWLSAQNGGATIGLTMRLCA